MTSMYMCVGLCVCARNELLCLSYVAIAIAVAVAACLFLRMNSKFVRRGVVSIQWVALGCNGLQSVAVSCSGL